jgi:hypothetical protein
VRKEKLVKRKQGRLVERNKPSLLGEALDSLKIDWDGDGDIPPDYTLALLWAGNGRRINSNKRVLLRDQSPTRLKARSKAKTVHQLLREIMRRLVLPAEDTPNVELALMDPFGNPVNGNKSIKRVNEEAWEMAHQDWVENGVKRYEDIIKKFFRQCVIDAYNDDTHDGLHPVPRTPS